MGDEDTEEGLVELASKWLLPADRGSIAEHARHLTEVYDVKRSCQTVFTYCARHSLSNVALQFPDHLLYHAPFICQALKYYADCMHREFNIESMRNDSRETLSQLFFYVIGDNTCGGCCVDEKTAKHLDTHVIIHYGNACLSSVPSIPVLYVFPQVNIGDPQLSCQIVHDSLASFEDIQGLERVVILYDISLHGHFEGQRFRAGDCSATYSQALQKIRVDVARPRLLGPHSIQDSQQSIKASPGNIVGPLHYDESSVPRSRTAFLWFTDKIPSSDEWPAVVRNAAITLGTGNDPCAKLHFVSFADGKYSSISGVPLPDANRFLRRRFVQIEKIKSASIFGLIPGDQSVDNNSNMTSRCKKILESSGKSYYTFVIGKPEPQKLANFPEIDVFVLASCPENAIFDSADFLRPIVTPLELEAALFTDGDIFSRPYSLEPLDMVQNGEYPCVDDSTSNNVASDAEDESSRIVARREKWTVSDNKGNGGAEFLQKRLWTGLKFDQGGLDDNTVVDDLSVEIQPGQSGIASGYDREVRGEKSESRT